MKPSMGSVVLDRWIDQIITRLKDDNEWNEAVKHYQEINETDEVPSLARLINFEIETTLFSSAFDDWLDDLRSQIKQSWEEDE